MRFGLFGSAQARRPDPVAPDTDSSQGFRDWIENNVEAEALGFHSTFVVEHHFTGFGQVSASLNLLTWLGARTSTLRLGTAVLVLPWHNPVLLAELIGDEWVRTAHRQGYDEAVGRLRAGGLSPSRAAADRILAILAARREDLPEDASRAHIVPQREGVTPP